MEQSAIEELLPTSVPDEGPSKKIYEPLLLLLSLYYAAVPAARPPTAAKAAAAAIGKCLLGAELHDDEGRSVQSDLQYCRCVSRHFLP